MDQQDESRAHAVDRNAGKQEAGRRELTGAGCGTHHHEQNQTGADECARPDAYDAGHHVPVERDRDHGTQRRAGRHAQRVGRGERVSQHRLEQAAGERQRAPREEAQQRPRQTKVRENRPVRLLPLPDASPVERARADERQQQGRRREEQRRATQPRHDGSASHQHHWYRTQGREPPCSTVSRAENARSHCGIIERRLGRQIARHAPLRQHDQPRAERQGEVHVMRDRHACGPAIGFGAQHVETLQLLIDVEECRGLVKQQHAALVVRDRQPERLAGARHR